MKKAPWAGVPLFGPKLPPPECVLSPCKRYRYMLRIPLSITPRAVLFILANPSTAVVEDGVFKSDPTITRCINFAKSWGYGALLVANVRAWRETKSKDVPEDPLAIGPDNDEWIERLTVASDQVICGWGKLGGERGPVVLKLVRKMGKKPYALRLNGDGSPEHPLYIPARAEPFMMPR